MIIVTGGTQGIGRATAEVLSQAGQAVLVAGRDPDAGQRVAAELPHVHYVQADLAREADCRAVVDKAMELGQGRIAGLVNNAGIGRRHVFADTNLSDWDEVMNTNARSVFMMTRFALDGLTAARGAVVNVASVAGLAGEERLAIYTASKAALIALTQSLALELGHLVRFNAVCPGQIDTRMMAKTLSDAKRKQAMEARIPVGRVADPREVAELIVWLLSAKASYVNGAIIPVDGGETAGLREII